MATSTSNTKWMLWKSIRVPSINDGFSATKPEDFSGIFRMFDDLRGRQLKHGLFQVCGNLVRACQNYMLVEAAMDGDLMISIWWPQNMILNDESVGLWIRKHWVIVRQHWGYKQQLMRMAAIFHQAGWLFSHVEITSKHVQDENTTVSKGFPSLTSDEWSQRWPTYIRQVAYGSAFNVSGVKTTKKLVGIRQEHLWVLICNAFHKITHIQATIMGIACIRRKQRSRKRFASKIVTPQTYPTRASIIKHAWLLPKHQVSPCRKYANLEFSWIFCCQVRLPRG